MQYLCGSWEISCFEPDDDSEYVYVPPGACRYNTMMLVLFVTGVAAIGCLLGGSISCCVYSCMNPKTTTCSTAMAASTKNAGYSAAASVGSLGLICGGQLLRDNISCQRPAETQVLLGHENPGINEIDDAHNHEISCIDTLLNNTLRAFC